MPVSSPSYFPPNSISDQIIGINAGKLATGARIFLAGKSAGNNSTVSDIIVIGDSAFSAGVTDVNAVGSVVIGSQAGEAMKNFSPGDNGPTVVIGGFAAESSTAIPSSVIIGVQALQNNTNAGGGTTRANVLIGFQACQNITDAGGKGVDSSVIIGYQACKAVGVTGLSILSSVIIGDSANASPASGAGGSLQASVIIGQAAAPTAVNLNNSIIIGAGACSSIVAGSAGLTLVGQGATVQNVTDCIVIGRAATLVNAVNIIGVVAIGTGIGTATANVFNSRAIVIGNDASQGTATVLSDNLIIETWDGGTRRSFVYGDMGTGNFVFGPSTNAQRDLAAIGGTNCIKILNGTPGAGSPIGGGFFYVTAGVLHWLDSAGNDTTLSVPAAPTTGTSTATFIATNKPGATTGAGPVAWENRVIDGISYQSPLWAT